MLESLMQVSFINALKTGNPILDVLISGAILSLVTWIVSHRKETWSKLKDLVSSLLRGRVKCEISFFGEELLVNGDETRNYSDGFCAMLHMINISTLKEVTAFEEVRTSRKDNSWWRHDDKKKEEDDRIMLKPSGNMTRPFRITSTIYCEVTTEKLVSDKPHNHVERKVTTIRVYSYVIDADALKKFAEESMQKYDTHMKEEIEKNQFYFVTKMIKDPNAGDITSDLVLSYDEYHFRSSRAFGNIFYTQKKEVQRRLDFFLNNRQWYHERGVPYSLGFLFYGPPGTGKTSTIKSIANHTKRHIVEVSLGRIRTYRDLQKVFHDPNFNGKFIPPHKVIYVIEDIDCLDDIVKSRTGEINKEFAALQSENLEDKKKKEEDSSDSASDKELDDKTVKQVKGDLGERAKIELARFKEFQKLFERDPITLSHLLNILDGILETPGRILIISSNHPEKLDEALIRPGRIDMKVEFGKSTVADTISVLEMFYKEPFPTAETFRIPDKVFTAAQVYNFCFQSTTMGDAIKRIASSKLEFNKFKKMAKKNPPNTSTPPLNEAEEDREFLTRSSPTVSYRINGGLSRSSGDISIHY